MLYMLGDRTAKAGGLKPVCKSLTIIAKYIGQFILRSYKFGNRTAKAGGLKPVCKIINNYCQIYRTIYFDVIYVRR